MFDRIERDGERVLYHYVIVDYLCRWRAGEAGGLGRLDVAWARPEELGRYDLPPKALEVVQDAFAAPAICKPHSPKGFPLPSGDEGRILS